MESYCTIECGFKSKRIYQIYVIAHVYFTFFQKKPNSFKE